MLNSRVIMLVKLPIGIILAIVYFYVGIKLISLAAGKMENETFHEFITFFLVLVITIYPVYSLLSRIRIWVFTLFGFKKNKTNSHEGINNYKPVPLKNKGNVLSDFEIKNNINFSILIKNLKNVNCKSGVNQINGLNNRFLNFKEILTETIATDELIYVRYNDKINELSLSVVNNLRQSFLLLKSISAINFEKDVLQLYCLMKDDNPNKKVAYEMRLDLLDSQNSKAKKLIINNESMLTKIDILISDLSIVNMKNIDWDSSVDGLIELKN